ncbi:MAG: glycosyltransferase [Candidatus Limnocylindrales bacterium]
MVDRLPLRLVYLGDPNETHTRRWVGWFADHGHEVSLVVPADMPIESPLQPEVQLVRLPAFGGSRLKMLSYRDGRIAVRSAIVPLHPDVVHVHYLTGYGWLAWESGIRPYAITVWGSDVFRTIPASRKARWLGRLALRAADLVTADSRDLAEGAIAAGARRDRTREAQFGVDMARFAPGEPDPGLRARLGLGQGRVVFSARTLLGFYRHDVVVRALALLPDDVQLLLSARHEDPAVRASLEALAVDLGVADRVRIVDTVAHEDMPGVLRLSSVVVSVPETDGTPVTILEALAVGTRVVASDVPSVREWLGMVDPDALVPVGEVEATATALRRALELPAVEAARLAAAGRALVGARADHDANMRRVEADYYRLAAGEPPGSPA